MKSFRGTIIFTLIVVGAGLYSYFEVFKKENEEAAKKEINSQIYKLKIEEISRIELTNGDHLVILQKTGDLWNLEKPLADKSDQTQVKNFLDTVLREKTSSVVEEGDKVNLKTFGLEKPEFRLKLVGSQVKDNKPTNLTEDVSYGSVKAYDGSIYSRVADEKKVSLAPSYLNTVLNKKADDFRNKNLFTTGIADVDSIRIEGKEKLELSREKQNWKMLEPKNYFAQASSESIQSFLDLVRNVKGTEIVSEEKNDVAQIKKYHLDKPAVVLKLHRAQDPKDYVLKISDPKSDKDHNVYLMASDANTILKGVESNLDTVDKAAFDFTDKHQAFIFGALDVGAIKIVTNDFKAEFKKVGNTWQNADTKDKREPDTLKLDDFLGKFSHLEAKSIVKEKDEKLKNEIAVLDSNNTEVFKMKWGESFEDKSTEKKSPKIAGKKTPAVMKLVNVRTSKFKETLVLPLVQIENLALKKLFKNPDPVQLSTESLAVAPKKSTSGAALDQHLPPANLKEK